MKYTVPDVGTITFNPIVDGQPAWQRQLRDSYLDRGAPDGLIPSLKSATVQPISKTEAERIILAYEWLGTMAGTTQHYGIFFGPYLGGVACFGGLRVTGGMETHRMFGIEPTALRVLARGACVHWAPPHTNSKLVSNALRLLHASDPSARLVIAYADTDAGEIGTIYQACNWTYIGRGSSKTLFVDPNGGVHHEKILNVNTKPEKMRHVTRAYVARYPGITRLELRSLLMSQGWTTLRTNPKHRYVYVLNRHDRELIAKVGAMSMAYPKRSNDRLELTTSSNLRNAPQVVTQLVMPA